MPTKKYKPEQIVSLLRQIEVAVARGKATPQVCRDAGISVRSQPFCRRLKWWERRTGRPVAPRTLARAFALIRRPVSTVPAGLGEGLWQ